MKIDKVKVKINTYKNAIQCKKCLDIIESLHTHDFKFCSCKSVAVDEGLDYLRRCGSIDDYTELTGKEK